jgi:hypothetical protein
MGHARIHNTKALRAELRRSSAWDSPGCHAPGYDSDTSKECSWLVLDVISFPGLIMK